MSHEKIQDFKPPKGAARGGPETRANPDPLTEVHTRSGNPKLPRLGNSRLLNTSTMRPTNTTAARKAAAPDNAAHAG